MLGNGDWPQFYERKSHKPIVLKSNRPPRKGRSLADQYSLGNRMALFVKYNSTSDRGKSVNSISLR